MSLRVPDRVMTVILVLERAGLDVRGASRGGYPRLPACSFQDIVSGLGNPRGDEIGPSGAGANELDFLGCRDGRHVDRLDGRFRVDGDLYTRSTQGPAAGPVPEHHQRPV